MVLAVSLQSAFVTFDAYAQGAALTEATKEQKKQATKAFINGMKAFEGGRYEEALKDFNESYGAVRSPNSRLMIARTMAKLGQDVAAYDELEATIEDAEEAAKTDEKYAKTADAAREELKALTKRVALITLDVQKVPSGSSITVGDRAIPEADWSNPVVVQPGQVSVTLTTPDGQTVTETATAEAGGTSSVLLAPKPKAAPPPPPPPEPAVVAPEPEPSGFDQRTAAYVAGGVGAAGLITFGVFGILSNSKYSDLEDGCQDRLCPAGLRDEAHDGDTYQSIANIGLAVGIVGLGTGAALFFTSGDDSDEDTASRTPKLGVGLGTVSGSGRF